MLLELRGPVEGQGQEILAKLGRHKAKIKILGCVLWRQAGCDIDDVAQDTVGFLAANLSHANLINIHPGTEMMVTLQVKGACI